MPATIRRVGILTALHKPQAVECTQQLVRRLQQAGAEVLIDPRMAKLDLEDCAECATEQWGKDSELLIAMGGDGTLLSVARAGAPSGTPLLGVDLGGFGFLAQEQFEQVLESLDSLLAGQLEIEEHLMLSACVVSEGTSRCSFLGFNDAVIAKTEPRRLVPLKTWVDDEFVTVYPADGLIVSTPTGSTAYNLSAGGPLVDPRVDCLLLTPICPHTLYSRPLIVPAKAEIRVTTGRYHERQPQVSLTVDGQLSEPLAEGEEILISAAPFPARLVRLGDISFYGRLREKLRWGAER